MRPLTLFFIQMHLLYFAEHFDPVIGGATHLTKMYAQTMVELGHTVTLVVPSFEKGSGVEIVEGKYPYKVVRIGVDAEYFEFKLGKRKEFVRKTNEFLRTYLASNKVDIAHIITGLYLVEGLDLPFLREKGVKVIAKILNVPPEECSTTWEGDKFLTYWKEQLRLLGVRWINKRRIQAQKFDAYTTISQHSKNLISNYITDKPIHIIHLGCEYDGFRTQDKIHSQTDTVQILTAGGFIPHKRQHWIPEIAKMLKDKGIRFQWYAIGPIRHKQYAPFVENKVRALGVENEVKLVFGVPKPELIEHYKRADVYVQPSKEEGFCMTALDALLYDVPLVGTKAGSIPEFTQIGGGILAGESPKAVFEAICSILEKPDAYKHGDAFIQQIAQDFSWESAGRKFEEMYSELLK